MAVTRADHEPIDGKRRPGELPGGLSSRRAFSVAAGSLLALGGLARGGMAGLAASTLGGGLVYSGLAGNVPPAVSKLLGARGGTTGRAAATVHGQSARAERAVTIDKPRDELYRFWRDFAHVVYFMEYVESVQVLDDKHSHWVMALPGRRIEWDAQIINDVPGELIAWKSVGDADIANAGSVSFKDGPPGRGTTVRLVINYQPPLGRLGALAAKALPNEPGKIAGQTLRRFKQLMETGEIATGQYRPGVMSYEAEGTPISRRTSRVADAVGASS